MASNKALKGLNAIRLNKKVFHNQGAFAINNFKCVFNSLLPLRNMAPPNLKNELKKKLISISARAIKTWMYYPDRMIYLKISTKWKIELCQMPSRPTNVPFNFSNFTMIMKCRLTGLISTLIKIFTTRQTTFSIECIFLDNFIYRQSPIFSLVTKSIF